MSLASPKGGNIEPVFILVMTIQMHGYTRQKYLLNLHYFFKMFPDNKVHGANMGPIWGRQDPGGPHVGPMNFVIWVMSLNRDWYPDTTKKARIISGRFDKWQNVPNLACVPIITYYPQWHYFVGFRLGHYKRRRKTQRKITKLHKMLMLLLLRWWWWW